jgi:hypothetical protein
MPLDQVQSYDPFYSRMMIGAELKFAWLPETCNISGKRIWLKWGYRLTRIITGPGESIFEYRWHEKSAHLVWLLTR